MTSKRPLLSPLDENTVRGLRVGDFVLLSGTVFTARDAVHQYLHHGEPSPCDLHGGILYHCGPVAKRTTRGWQITAAGPTTSIREEPYMDGLIATYGLRAIIGKGGMGTATLAACRRHGAVYLHAVGGAAQVLASRIQRVNAVHLLERFGIPEAIWELTVHDFPLLVTMDSHGASLHANIAEHSRNMLAGLL